MSDLAAITDLVHRVALYSDKAGVEQWGDLLTDDIHFDLFGSVTSTRADAMKGSSERRASGATGPGSHSRHLVTTAVITVDGDRATGDVTVLFYLNADTQPTFARMVNYADEYRRTDAGWKLSRRVAPHPNA